MLEIDSVSLTFWSKAVLSGCYISCKPGEIVGLLGRNGSGKSCLLKVIFGVLKADFKHQRINDKIIGNGFSSGEIAYLPQDSFLPPFIKVRDILASFVQQDFALGNSIFAEKADQRVGDLSGGELRLLECIWILNLKADYILLDEPFSGISPVQTELLQHLIRQASKLKGIILTDHIYRALTEVSDRIVLLHNNAVYNINDESDLIRYQYIPGIV